MTPSAPRIHRWLLSVVTPSPDRAELLADLEDEMVRRAGRDGAAPARRWYRRQARRSLGPILYRRVGPPRRDPDGGRRLVASGLLQDVLLAIRSLRAAPAFALSGIVMLALGIGAFTVVYAVVDAAIVRPLPFGDRSDRLVTVHSVHPTLTSAVDDADVSYADLVDLRAQTTTFEALEGALGRSVSVSTGDESRRVLAASITPGLFPMLGVSPLVGRGFSEDDAAEPGFETVVLLGHALWRDLFAGDPRAVGGPLLLNGRSITVVGVMPPGFDFPSEHQMWLPYRSNAGVGRQNRGWLAVGLLRPGQTLDDGRSELRGLAARLADQHPDTNRDWSAQLLPIRDYFVSIDDEGTVLVAVTLLLLAACANIGGLVVARGAGRRRELTVRAALGASRRRLIRWLVTETVVLAAAGGVLGLAFAAWGIRALVAWMPEPPPYWAMPALDFRVAAVAVGATLVVALLAGLIPAIRLSRVRVAGALAAGTRTAGGTLSHRRMQHLLVVGQVSVSFSLVVGALLLGRSATALLDADAGFDHRPIFSARFYIAGDQYDPIASRIALVDEVVRRVSVIPGVVGAAATGVIPTDDGGSDIRLMPPTGPESAFDQVGGQLIPVTPSFWDALNLSLSEGRTFTASEAANPEGDAVIVNQRLARAFWPDQSVVTGRTFQVVAGNEPVTLRVVGVAPDLVYEEFGEVTPQSQLNVYVPYARAGWRTQAVLLNVAGPDPAIVAGAVRAEIRAIDPGLAVYDALTMVDRRQYNHWGSQFVGRTMTVFAMAALLLACVGTYGITSYGVAERRREIGVRMAIGATSRDIQRLFLGTGARVAAAGLIVGLPLALLTARSLEGMLFAVSPWQGTVWVTLPTVLLAAILAASYWPARRASALDPAKTLRE